MIVVFDMLGREIKPGNLLLVEPKSKELSTLNKNNYMIYVAEGKAFRRGCVYGLSTNAYIIENPSKIEIELKQELVRDFREYQQKQMAIKRIPKKELRERRKASLVPGNVFSKKDCVWIYLGKTHLVYEKTPFALDTNEFTGYTYMRLDALPFTVEGYLASINGKEITFEDFYNLDGHSRYLRRECNNIYHEEHPSYPVLVNHTSIVVTKEPSKRFTAKLGSINLLQKNFHGYMEDEIHWSCSYYYRFDVEYIKEE